MSDLTDIFRGDAKRKLALSAIDSSTDVATAVADNAVAALTSVVDGIIQFVPVGSAIRAFGQAISTYKNYRFFNKLIKFLNAVDENISQDELDKFLGSIADRDEEVSEFMLALLDKSESEAKAEIMGILYASAAKGKIDIDTMLRLCSIIEGGFLADFRKLPDFVEPCDTINDACNTFVNLGLIDNELGGFFKGKPSIQLNQLGLTLLKLLREGGWLHDQ